MKINGNNTYDNLNKVMANNKPSKTGGENRQPVKGDVLQGEIKDIRQGNVTIKLADGRVMDAKTTENFQFTIGQEVTFTVKDSSEGQLVIKPMFDEGELTNATLLKILENANKSLTKGNVEVVLKLMENSMSVDSKTLGRAINLSNHFSDASIDDILFLMKNDIDVTKESLKQLGGFKNPDDQIIKSLSTISDNLAKLPQTEENTEVTKAFLKGNETLTKLFEAISNEARPMETKEVIQGLDNGYKEIGEQPLSNNENLNQAMKGHQQGIKPELRVGNNIKEQSNEDKPVIIKNVLVDDLMTEKDVKLLEDRINSSIKSYDATNETNLINGQEKSSFKGISLQGKSIDNILNFIRDNEFSTPLKEKLFGYVREEITRSMINKETFMDKEVLKDPEAYNKYYEKLTDKVDEIIKQNGNITESKLSEVVDEAKEIKSNIEFMTEINKNFNFFQFPMLLDSQVLNSELYVFNNKSQLKKNKGSITALVRLDLVNLGHVDAYVVKDENNIDCKFYIEDNEKGTRINEHLNMLQHALTAAGFKVTSLSVVKKDINFDIVEDFLEDHNKSGDVKRVSFDMRA